MILSPLPAWLWPCSLCLQCPLPSLPSIPQARVFLALWDLGSGAAVSLLPWGQWLPSTCSSQTKLLISPSKCLAHSHCCASSWHDLCLGPTFSRTTCLLFDCLYCVFLLFWMLTSLVSEPVSSTTFIFTPQGQAKGWSHSRCSINVC